MSWNNILPSWLIIPCKLCETFHREDRRCAEPKQELVGALIEEHGEDKAIAMQQVADAEKAAHYEAFFKSEVLGTKSTYKDSE